ncbi:WXG100 family type VII secretion target [Streptomyces sp. PTD5-9]|uniref:WXG100 family type VII secretion target n=1 Tax=Streptomyces sp. PTD5-9 TaxID=3120150 RepID=UPI0030098248
MPTPPPGNIQTSSQSANQLGYNALGQAQDGVKRSQDDVKTTMSGLVTTYGGEDGGAYQRLLAEWSEQVDVITKNLGDMMRMLEQTGLAQRRTQSNTTNLIASTKSSNDVFSTLTP